MPESGNGERVISAPTRLRKEEKTSCGTKTELLILARWPGRRNGGYKPLAEGQKLDFDVSEGTQGRQAKNLEGGGIAALKVLFVRRAVRLLPDRETQLLEIAPKLTGFKR